MIIMYVPSSSYLHLFLLLIILHKITKCGCSSPVSCPAVCQSMACNTGALDCQQGGLDTIPEELPMNINRVLLAQHRFRSSILSPSIFRLYFQYNITKVTIRDCAITNIEPRSFINFPKLLVLDLSANHIQQILPYTFAGLSLAFLRLDYNPNLKLNNDSFSGLQLISLSLIGCNMKQIDYGSLYPLNQKLIKLNLAKNQLTTISSIFEPLFRRLTELQLNDNPFTCSCSLKWLSKVLKYRQSKITSSNNPQSSYESSNSKLITKPSAKCAQPTKLKTRFIYNIDETEFACSAPNLVELDIALYGLNKARLSCIVNDDTSSLDSSVLDRITWKRVIVKHGSTIYESLPTTTTISNPDKNNNNSTVMISRSNNDDKSISYMCFARNSNGNSSAEIRINWPPKTINSNDNNNVKYQPTNIPDNNNNNNNNNNEQNKYLNNNDIIYTRQFTLLEMIGAVVGTFTGTLLIFGFSYRLIIHKMQQRNRKRKLYETVLYSDSQTYDIPQNNLHHQHHHHHLGNGVGLTASNNNLVGINNNNNNNNSTLTHPIRNFNSPTQQQTTQSNTTQQPYYHPIQYNPVVTTNPHPNNNINNNSPAHYLDFKNPPQIINNNHITQHHQIMGNSNHNTLPI